MAPHFPHTQTGLGEERSRLTATECCRIVVFTGCYVGLFGEKLAKAHRLYTSRQPLKPVMARNEAILKRLGYDNLVACNNVP